VATEAGEMEAEAAVVEGWKWVEVIGARRATARFQLTSREAL